MLDSSYYAADQQSYPVAESHNCCFAHSTLWCQPEPAAVMVYGWHLFPTGIGRLRKCFKQLLSILILVAGFVEDVELATADGQRHLWLVGLPPAAAGG